ncbi:MAG: tetratricopeptide repeat protein [Thermoplasmata archaeon]|nr:tetratricopeptide repeat protein [Thermoplasmata archaeon]MBE3141731.1 tetratricopeptide repeat protein [Thermoplasmata archaeon]
MKKSEEALYLIQQGKFVEAKKILEDILLVNPNDIEVLYNLGMCLTDLGQPDKAVVTLEQCIKLKPDYSNAYVALGMAYFKTGDLEYAERFFFDALKLDSNNSYALSNLGGLFGKMEDIEKSLYYLEKAYRINPSNPNTVYGLGYAYEQIQDYEKADKYYKELLEMDAPAQLKNLTKEGLRKIAVSSFKSKGFRMDAVFYLIGAFQLFNRMNENKIKYITFEIAMKGWSGFDLNNPDKKYTLKTLNGEFTGLQLVCYMYAGFKRIEQTLDVGIDLSDEYKMALKLFHSGMVL